MTTEQQGEMPVARSTPRFTAEFDEGAPGRAGGPNTGLIVIAVAGLVLAGGGLVWNILGPRSAPASPAPVVRTFMSEQTQMMREAMQMAREAQQAQREHMARMEAEMRGEYTGADGGDDPR